MLAFQLFWLWQFGVLMVNGLQFEVTNLSVKTLTDSCAVLACEVDKEKHSDVEYIESMTLFNHSNQHTHTKEAIITVSPFEPRMNKKCDENTIAATFTAHRTEIRMAVHDVVECQTGIFSCEVKYLSVDGHGKIKDVLRFLAEQQFIGPPLEYGGYGGYEGKLNKKLKRLERITTKLTSSLEKLETKHATTCESPLGVWPREIIKPLLGVPFLCDTATDGGGWTIIQRRTIGDVDFNRTWADYKKGFGSLTGDFWFGNDNIHTLTSKEPHDLRFDLFYEYKHYYAYYNTISVDSEENKYKLKVGEYSGTIAGTDSLALQNNMKFSTYDQDNDNILSRKCSIEYGSGWWFNNCYYVNLNGNWGGQNWSGLSWKAITSDKSVWSSEIKVRPKKSSTIW